MSPSDSACDMAGESANRQKTPPHRPIGPMLRSMLLALILGPLMGAQTAQAEDIPQRIIDNHRATMGCWLADIDDDELASKAMIIHLDVQTFYGLICSSSLSGDSFRLYQVEDERDEWANLLSFPQLNTKLGWYATTQLQKPTWDEKNKLLRSEIPKQGITSSCRQFSIYAWQSGRFHIAQIGLSGDCEEKENADKDLIIYPFVEEVAEGEAAGVVPHADGEEKPASGETIKDGETSSQEDTPDSQTDTPSETKSN